MTYLVFSAGLTDVNGESTGEVITFCCSSVRLVSLLAEIDRGERLLDKASFDLIHWTKDRNEARNMAAEL